MSHTFGERPPYGFSSSQLCCRWGFIELYHRGPKYPRMTIPMPEVNLPTAKAKQRRQNDCSSGISHVRGSESSCLRISAAANRASQLSLALIMPTFSRESSRSSPVVKGGQGLSIIFICNSSTFALLTPYRDVDMTYIQVCHPHAAVVNSDNTFGKMHFIIDSSSFLEIQWLFPASEREVE